ncbi:MAG: hypothetical protein ACETVX_04250 [bacterium]|nr:hypothetical protein [candidate division WOR-3 bacterium]MDH5683592.1 hypothetical protein [candidate division WOR-3 bacterium]
MSNFLERIIDSACLKHFVAHPRQSSNQPKANCYEREEDWQRQTEICHICPFFSLIFFVEKDLNAK